MLENIVNDTLKAVHRTQGIKKNQIAVTPDSRVQDVPVYVEIAQPNGSVVTMKASDARFYRSIGLTMRSRHE